MTIDERELGEVRVLDMRGRLVLDDGDRELKERVAALLEAGSLQIVMNVAEVPYVDSAGLGALVSVCLTARAKGGAVKLLNPSKKLLDLLTMARLLKVIDLLESEAHALESFGPRPSPLTS